MFKSVAAVCAAAALSLAVAPMASAADDVPMSVDLADTAHAGVDFLVDTST